MKLELQVVQLFNSRLITAIQDNVSTIGDGCRTRGLITEDTYSRCVTNTTGSMINSDKARCLLEAVTNCIKTNSSCFQTFMEILTEKLPDGSKKIVDEMNNEYLKKRAEIAASTDDESSVSGIEDVLKPRTVSAESDHNQPLTTAVGKRSNSAGAHCGEQFDGVHLPIPVSNLAEGKSTYGYLPLGSQAAGISPRRQTLQHALEVIKMADLDAKQDEARYQDLQQQNDELRAQRRQLKKALEKEKKLTQELEDKRSNLQALIRDKEKETTEMKCEIKALKMTMSGTESQRDIFRSKSSELEKELVSIKVRYNAKISTVKKTITRLEEKLRKRELMIEQKENAVQERSREMERLLHHNQELVRQHSMKDEEILSLRRKLSMWEEVSLERGHRCSLLTHVFVSWFLFVLVGILIVCVSVYKYLYP